ncbi:MAG: hypothetical protein J0I36_12145, partial [Pandoraea sp.]|nr:hypothetical protein [Pandoraea sp.]
MTGGSRTPCFGFQTPGEVRSDNAERFSAYSGAATAERSDPREKESFERWQAQLAHRDRWLKSRREERRWQAKWQAAG